MSYLYWASITKYYRNYIKAIWPGLYIVCCKKVPSGPLQFMLFGRGNNLFGWRQAFINPGLYLDKNDSAVGRDHNQVDFAGLAGKISGEGF